MTRRTRVLVSAALGALLCAPGLFTTRVSARPAAQDEPMPGSKMTRQQVIDRLTSATPGTRVSIDRGRQLYEEVCAACHIFGDIGTSVGPDLTTLSSRFRRADVLDSILWPSKTISDQYAVTVFELTDGTYASGVVIREDARAVYLKNAEYLDRPLPIALGRIKDRTESTVSLMPEGLVATHSLDDIDSLVAYVLGGK
jgi:putative heme-binding domain-containing protein